MKIRSNDHATVKKEGCNWINIDQEIQQKLLSLMKEESYKPLTVQEIQELIGFEASS